MILRLRCLKALMFPWKSWTVGSSFFQPAYFLGMCCIYSSSNRVRFMKKKQLIIARSSFLCKYHFSKAILSYLLLRWTLIVNILCSNGTKNVVEVFSISNVVHDIRFQQRLVSTDIDGVTNSIMIVMDNFGWTSSSHWRRCIAFSWYR